MGCIVISQSKRAILDELSLPLHLSRHWILTSLPQPCHLLSKRLGKVCRPKAVSDYHYISSVRQTYIYLHFDLSYLPAVHCTLYMCQSVRVLLEQVTEDNRNQEPFKSCI